MGEVTRVWRSNAQVGVKEARMFGQKEGRFTRNRDEAMEEREKW